MPWSLLRVGPRLSKCEHGAVLTEDTEDLSREPRFKSPSAQRCCPPVCHFLDMFSPSETVQTPHSDHTPGTKPSPSQRVPPIRPHYGLICRGGTSTERLSYFPTLTQPRQASSSTSLFPEPGHTAAEDQSPLYSVTPGSPTSETFTFSPSR